MSEVKDVSVKQLNRVQMRAGTKNIFVQSINLQTSNSSIYLKMKILSLLQLCMTMFLPSNSITLKLLRFLSTEFDSFV